MTGPVRAALCAVGLGVLATAVAVVGPAFPAPPTGVQPTGPMATSEQPAPTSTSRSPSTDPTPAAPARRARSVAVPERPTALRLPSGVRVPVRPAGTRRDGTLGVPDDIGAAGWWRGGSRLGDPFGSTLVAAHVDSATRGLGPFAELLTVRWGARFRLSSHHLQQTFEARSLRMVPKSGLADQSWIFAARGARRLTLVTCAPPYDAARGGYQRLAVVTARAVAPAERRAAP